MSAIFDQLRISDNGQKLYIDAHVNKAPYFDNVYLEKITICTEDQVSESNPETYGNEFIYQKTIEPETSIVPVYGGPQILSGQDFIDYLPTHTGLRIENTCPDYAESKYISVVFSGKYSLHNTPRLIITSTSFNPQSDHMNSPEVLVIIDGEQHTEEGHTTWRFTGKGEVGNNSYVCLYLYDETDTHAYTLVRFDETTDANFCHFLWNFYYTTAVQNKKEVHLVLDKDDFDEAYLNNQKTEPDPTLPIATVRFTNNTLSKNMFFVYLEFIGPYGEDTPCTLDEMTLGVTYDYGVFFNQAMNYTRELADNCVMPQNFANFILNYDALKIAVETEHYTPAIGFWRRLINDKSASVSYVNLKPCGCHG